MWKVVYYAATICAVLKSVIASSLPGGHFINTWFFVAFAMIYFQKQLFKFLNIN